MITHTGSSGITQAQYLCLLHMEHKVLCLMHTKGVVEDAAGEGALTTSTPSRRDVYLAAANRIVASERRHWKQKGRARGPARMRAASLWDVLATSAHSVGTSC